jgi:hypothetical protein
MHALQAQVVRSHPILDASHHCLRAHSVPRANRIHLGPSYPLDRAVFHLDHVPKLAGACVMTGFDRPIDFSSVSTAAGELTCCANETPGGVVVNVPYRKITMKQRLLKSRIGPSSARLKSAILYAHSRSQRLCLILNWSLARVDSAITHRLLSIQPIVVPLDSARASMLDLGLIVIIAAVSSTPM